jgi:thioredoxin reductase (NADPH)
MLYTTPLLVIGSGPAGCTAALYGARALLDPIMVRGPQPGGQLTITTDVENWPGLLHTQGPDLTAMLEQHAQSAGARLLEGIVTTLDAPQGPGDPFLATFDSGSQIQANAVILAMGAAAKWLGIPGEDTYRGFGVSACATCDGFFFRGQEVAVIGGGNTAMEEALFLTRFASHVHLIHRRDRLRGEKILQQRVLGHEKITVHWNHKPEAILGVDTPAPSVTGLLLDHQGKPTTLACTGVFVAIGHAPASHLVQSLLDVDAHGYVKVTPGRTTTSLPGVFACGDLIDPLYRQAVTAAGSGCMAALDAERWLAQAE